MSKKINLIPEKNRTVSSELVAIVIPRYKKYLSFEEEISFKHLVNYLGHYDKYFVAPMSLNVGVPGFRVTRFDDHFFTSVAAYSKLLLSSHFYEEFANYHYILIYQIDCLVFSNRLNEWCNRGYDYVGAPWFKSKWDPTKGFSRVGNGGLSLRNVRAFLNVLGSKRYLEETVPYRRQWFSTTLADLQALPPVQRLVKKTRVLRHVRRGVKHYTAHYTLNEDHFWADRATLFLPEFKIAPVNAALDFAFEMHPHYCFEQNGRRLPFGCHAWQKWDPDFWQPYLLH